MPSLRRGKAAGIIASIASLAVLGGVAAQFTTSTTSAPQEIGTGTLAMSLDDVSPISWTDDISNMAAGDTVERFVDLRNSGTLDLYRITISQTNTATLLATADHGIDIGFQSCSVAWDTVKGTCAGVTNTVLKQTSLKEWATQVLDVPGMNIPVGTSAHLKEIVHLAPGATNDVQALVESVTFTFGGSQKPTSLPAPGDASSGWGGSWNGGWGETGNGATDPAGAPVGSPVTVSKLTATSSATGINLAWPSVVGADGYRLWRCEAPSLGASCMPSTTGTPWLGSTSGTSAQDTDVKSSTTYSYVVKAYDTRGEGAVSALASATTAPAAPSGVSLVREGTSAKISFNNPADAFSGATRFKVRVSTTGANAPAVVESAQDASSVTVDGLDPSEPYSFSLVAFSPYGTSAAYVINGEPSAPASPQMSAMTVDDQAGTASFGWAPQPQAKSYSVYRNDTLVKTTAETNYSEVLDFTKAAKYTVVATNGTGSSPVSSALTYTPVLPGAPANVVAIPADQGARVSFTAPDQRGSGGLTGYAITVAGPGVNETKTVGADATTVTFDSLQVGDTALNFTVKAIAKSGQGQVGTTVQAAAPTVGGVLSTEFVQTSTAHSCPSGGTLSGTTCGVASTTHGATGMTTYSCASGALNGTNCNIPARSYSATGSTYVSSYSYSCPSGGSLSGTTCYKSTTSSYAASSTWGSCPAGQISGEYYGGGAGECLTPYQQNGQTYYRVSGSRPRVYSCPSGGTLSGSTCTTTSSTSYAATSSPNYSTSYSCPSGGSLSGTTCNVPASTVQATSTTTYSCPTGESLSGSTCTVPAYTYPATGTPVGYQDNLFTLKSVQGAQQVSINGRPLTQGVRVSLGKCPGATSLKATGIGGSTTKSLGTLCSA